MSYLQAITKCINSFGDKDLSKSLLPYNVAYMRSVQNVTGESYPVANITLFDSALKKLSADSRLVSKAAQEYERAVREAYLLASEQRS